MKALRCFAFSALVVLVAAPLAHADALCNDLTTPCIAAGTDYLKTGSGTYVAVPSPPPTFPYPPGYEIPLAGSPIVGAPGMADTEIERTSDAVINGGWEPVLLVTGLSLVSTDGSDLYVTLDPTDLSLDTGSIDVFGSLAGGTFDSFFTVYFDVCAGGDSGTGVGCGGFPVVWASSKTFTQNGDTWSPNPPPYAVIDLGPYANDPNPYNKHTGLPTNVVDFWPGPIKELTSGAQHNVSVSATPEPASLILLGTGLLGLAGLKGKKLLKQNS